MIKKLQGWHTQFQLPRLSCIFYLMRKGKVENGFHIWHGIGPDFPAMAGDNALDKCQPHAGAFELVSAMQTLENAKEFVGVLHVKADAIVFDEEDLLAGRLLKAADFYRMNSKQRSP